MLVESLGIIASLVIIRALWYKDMIKLRRWNLVGSLLYVLYGMLLKSPSLVFLNAVAVWVNFKAMKEGR